MLALFTHGHALIIGIANYPHVCKLPEVVLKDAQGVADLLRAKDHCGYPPTNVELLLDGGATGQGIREGLRRLARASASKDTAVVFFSGHGGRKECGPDAGTYLIPFDCDPSRLATAWEADRLAHGDGARASARGGLKEGVP